jgi:hypothetical protein
MSTYQQGLYHIVFSTKKRHRWLTDGFRENVFGYIENQMAHQLKQTFEDEYLGLLQ